MWRLSANQVVESSHVTSLGQSGCSNWVTWHLLARQVARIESLDAFWPIRLFESSHVTSLGQSGCSNQLTWSLLWPVDWRSALPWGLTSSWRWSGLWRSVCRRLWSPVWSASRCRRWTRLLCSPIWQWHLGMIKAIILFRTIHKVVTSNQR